MCDTSKGRGSKQDLTSSQPSSGPTSTGIHLAEGHDHRTSAKKGRKSPLRAEECDTQEQQKLNPNEPSSCSPSSSGPRPPGCSGYLCRLFMCIQGTKGSSTGRLCSPWMEAGEQSTLHEAPRGACSESESQSCAATAESHRPQDSVADVTHSSCSSAPASAAASLGRCPQHPQLSRSPICAVCPSSPAPLGAAMQPPSLSPVPKTLTKASCRHHHHQVFAPPGQVCTSLSKSCQDSQQQLFKQPQRDREIRQLKPQLQLLWGAAVLHRTQGVLVSTSSPAEASASQESL